MKVFHGKIISLDSDNHIYQYLVEDQGRIAYLGDVLPPEYKNGTPMIELGNKTLIPAFGDGHLHFSNWALFAASYFDVREARDIPEIQEIIRNFLTNKGKPKLILAFGVSKHSVSEKRLINRLELDQACPDIPLVIVCYDGHSAVFNSAMLEKFPDTVQSLPGFYGEDGHLFHEAYYKGVDFATSLIPPLDLVNSILKGYDLLADYGIGTIHATEGVGFPNDLDITLVSLIAKARGMKNKFQTRLFFQTMDVDKVLKRDLPRIGGCFATALDGCFGATDAALHEPYNNDQGNKGILYHAEEEVFEFARKANRAGLQIEMHAIGDAAVTRAVDAIEAALQDFPREDHRHTIIHACLIKPEDLQRIAELGIGITLQPGFLISPLEPIEYLEEILGDRISRSSPLRTILDLGIHLSGGSDAPVTHPDPIEGIYGACNHPYDPGQSVSISEALRMYTYEVAWTGFDEKERGSLEEGKVADLVILNLDPLALDPTDLLSLKVENIYLSGEEYQQGMGIPGMLWNTLVGSKVTI
jgi:predicted amidohydrolase YtcJ